MGVKKLAARVIDLYSVSEVKNGVIAVAHQLLSDSEVTREDAARELLSLAVTLNEEEHAILKEINRKTTS